MPLSDVTDPPLPIHAEIRLHGLLVATSFAAVNCGAVIPQSPEAGASAEGSELFCHKSATQNKSQREKALKLSMTDGAFHCPQWLWVKNAKSCNMAECIVSQICL